jgi:Pentapeptide repeats (8 copies)
MATVDLSGANLSGANFCGAKGLSRRDFDQGIEAARQKHESSPSEILLIGSGLK